MQDSCQIAPSLARSTCQSIDPIHVSSARALANFTAQRSTRSFVRCPGGTRVYGVLHGFVRSVHIQGPRRSLDAMQFRTHSVDNVLGVAPPQFVDEALEFIANHRGVRLEPMMGSPDDESDTARLLPMEL
jgi:hypothetical protein